MAWRGERCKRTPFVIMAMGKMLEMMWKTRKELIRIILVRRRLEMTWILDVDLIMMI